MRQRSDWRFRPGTTDEIAIEHVYEKNGYRLPDDMRGMNVIDIGGHIGTFAVACAERGAFLVVSYEPFNENYDLLVENTKDFEQCDAYEEGLGEGFGNVMLYQHPGNTGGHSFFPVELGITKAYGSAVGHPITAVPLSDMFEGLGDIDWLKMDCEGGELFGIPSLINEGLWERVANVAVEIHDGLPGKPRLLELMATRYDVVHNFQMEWVYKRRDA